MPISPPESAPSERPAPATLERWAYDYIVAETLAEKLTPPELPDARAQLAAPVRIARPGRPSELRVTWDKYKAPRSAHALRLPEKRAQLLHTFLHHELQAAELLCWALLAFPELPPAFGRGLMSICLDEIRHMQMYRTQIRRLGFDVGSFSVRDWFWERGPSAHSPQQFLALMGLGFEAGNLDHSQRFERLFLEAGDLECSHLMHTVGEEEVAHVAFAAHWFAQLGTPLDFASWVDALPAPLSPMVMRGKPLSRERRTRAGLSERFLDELEAWQPVLLGG